VSLPAERPVGSEHILRDGRGQCGRQLRSACCLTHRRRLASVASVARAPRASSWSCLRRLGHTFSELPENWRKLKVPTLEVMDTSELDSLVQLSVHERERLTELRDVAKAQQRKVLRVNCDLDIKRVDRLSGWIEHVKKDARRKW